MNRQDEPIAADVDAQPFLSRWSQRKLSEEGPQEADEPATTQAAETPPLPPGDEDMPPLETLDEQSDFSGFLSPRVSDGLRQLALRKLFASPAFNVCDGLDDYADDFTSFSKLGDIITADMRHRLQQEAEKLAQTLEQSDAQGAAPVPPAQQADTVADEAENPTDTEKSTALDDDAESQEMES